MSPEFIEQLIFMLQKHGLNALEFEQAGCLLSLKLDGSSLVDPQPAKEATRTFIGSPGMGVLRLAHPQRDEPFVALGAEVKEGQIVAFLQNDEVLGAIKADCSGVLVAALAQEGQVVGFSQPLFEMR